MDKTIISKDQAEKRIINKKDEPLVYYFFFLTWISGEGHVADFLLS